MALEERALGIATFDTDDGRCAWANPREPIYVAYHDEEWGVPEYDPRALWEKLVLDGFQAGLAWITVLRKREAFRAAFDGFDPDRWWVGFAGLQPVGVLLVNPNPDWGGWEVEYVGVVPAARRRGRRPATGRDRTSHVASPCAPTG